MEQDRQPWWADDPEIEAIRRRVLQEIENATPLPVDDQPDRFVEELGFSWGEIGRMLGVPRQALHRRFSRHAISAANSWRTRHPG